MWAVTLAVAFLVVTTSTQLECGPMPLNNIKFRTCHPTEGRYIGRALSYASANSTCTYHTRRISLSNDIETNPGPVRYPCSICSKPLRKNQLTLNCIVCSKSSHASCEGVNKNAYNTSSQWTCTPCILPPFTNSFFEMETELSSTQNDHDNDTSMSTADLKYTKGLKFMHINAQSAFPKIDEIRLMILESDPVVFGISETWFDNSIDNSEIQITNYTVYRHDRSDGWGGVALYINNRLDANLLNIPTPDKTAVETLWVKISLPKTRPILAGIVYAPSISNQLFEDLESVLDEVNTISASSRTPGEITCMGDFNCDKLKPTSWEWKKLSSVMNTLHMSQIISKPTRITQFSKTCIDHIWTTSPELYTNRDVITIPFSDHLLIFGVRKSVNRPKGQPRIINARSYRRFNNNDFIKDLEQAPWSSIEVSNDPDLAWSIFESLFTPICDAHAPFKQVKIPNNQPQWINDEYLACRIDLVRTRSRAQKSFSDADWLAYRNLRNKTNNLATRLKREFIETSINNAGNDSHKLWKTIKTVLPGSKHDVISSLRVGDSITNDGKLIVDNFNTFFSTIGENLAKAFNSSQDLNYTQSEETIPGEFHFTKIPEDDVLKLLKGIDGKKATGLDNISPKLLKIGYAQLCRPLAYIMNLSLTSGVVPSAWKKCRVSPIFKEGDHLDTSNYRPISVIPSCMKIFEKLVHSQLYHFVTDYNLLSSNQSGFRAMHSTQTCLLEVTDYLLDNFNSGLYTGVRVFRSEEGFRYGAPQSPSQPASEHWRARSRTQLV